MLTLSLLFWWLVLVLVAAVFLFFLFCHIDTLTPRLWLKRTSRALDPGTAKLDTAKRSHRRLRGRCQGYPVEVRFLEPPGYPRILTWPEVVGPAPFQDYHDVDLRVARIVVNIGVTSTRLTRGTRSQQRLRRELRRILHRKVVLRAAGGGVSIAFPARRLTRWTLSPRRLQRILHALTQPEPH